MAVLFPITQFFDNSGEPLSGGLVYTYTASTDTPKASYTTQAASVQHTNPVELDSAGRTSGIWLTGSNKIVVKDSTAATTFHTINVFNAYDPVDWTGLTATVADINGYAANLGAAGVVEASKGVVVDSSKNIATFGTVTAANLNATTSIKTPLIKDANGVTAITIASTASQVNGITLTPSATGNPVTIAATGSDSNLGLTLSSKGSGALKLNTLTLPSADGTSGQVLTTNGTGTLSFSTTGSIVKVASTTLRTLQTSTTVLPHDDTIPTISEGAEVLSLAYTPTSASSTLIIDINIMAMSNSSARVVSASLHQDGGASICASSDTNCVNFRHIMTSGTTSATTFTVRVGPSAAGSVYINGTAAGVQLYGGKANTSMIIWEVV